MITAVTLPFVSLTGDTSLIGMYGVIVIFYMIAIVSNSIFTVINKLAKDILSKVRSERKAGRV